MPIRGHMTILLTVVAFAAFARMATMPQSGASTKGPARSESVSAGERHGRDGSPSRPQWCAVDVALALHCGALGERALPFVASVGEVSSICCQCASVASFQLAIGHWNWILATMATFPFSDPHFRLDSARPKQYNHSTEFPKQKSTTKNWRNNEVPYCRSYVRSFHGDVPDGAG